ncbi:hypothetical protein chiPu_0022755 [Chiloscyllium punctatum]|uniref:Uncharacterized protein n=1 Tax=Chiloscyllium punctatum TaxID=137246 RepID=A0A401T9S1_CHIPU|nr:hypothetical protein [Chiloscyllium punctatum]
MVVGGNGFVVEWGGAVDLGWSVGVVGSNGGEFTQRAARGLKAPYLLAAVGAGCACAGVRLGVTKRTRNGACAVRSRPGPGRHSRREVQAAAGSGRTRAHAGPARARDGACVVSSRPPPGPGWRLRTEVQAGTGRSPGSDSRRRKVRDGGG